MPIYTIAEYRVKDEAVDKVKTAIEGPVRFTDYKLVAAKGRLE